MPHEYPNSAAFNAGTRENNPSEFPAQNNKERVPQRMAATEKENGRVPLGSANVKASIPEHIHDVNAKTFYKLGQFLGKGGFATCYQVTSEATGKQYAVKIVPKASLIKPKQKNKLLQEIKIHQSLRHDHIVRLYRVFEDDNFVYIMMELCECQTMLELLKQKTRLNDDEARPILLQLLAVVEYLHANHVIHRDLKLGNLFLKQGPMIKLGDFGLATLVYGENDRKRTICGTPNYIAPEILAGGEKGHSYEVDIWSFGVIMYTVLVGHPPFQRQEVKEIYEKIKVANFEFPKNIPVSLAAQDLINRLLHPNPDMRPKINDIRSHPYFSAPVQSPLPPPAAKRELVGILEPVEGAKQASSSESGLIFSIQQSIRKILSNYSSVTSELERCISPKEVYLVKWMDFSSKYGIGYLLSNGSSGFYFNDGSSLILTADKKRGHYFQPGEDNKKILVRESFLAEDPKDSVKHKLELMSKFDGFLHAPAAGPGTPHYNVGGDLLFVVKFFRTSKATFFRLSHRILQVNFFDHCKLIFSDEGRTIFFIDQEKRCLAFPVSISRVHLPSGITSKLQYVSEVFENMVKTSSAAPPINSAVRTPSGLGRSVYTSNT